MSSAGLLEERLEGEEEEGVVDMVERYRKSDMYNRTGQELGQVWQNPKEREERGEGRLPSAGYASNIFRQVKSSYIPYYSYLFPLSSVATTSKVFECSEELVIL